MKIWALLAVAAITVLSRRCVTHHEAGALLRDHQLEGQLTEDQIRIIRTGAIYTKLRRSHLLRSVAQQLSLTPPGLMGLVGFTFTDAVVSIAGQRSLNPCS
jgi:hypothetical protein